MNDMIELDPQPNTGLRPVLFGSDSPECDCRWLYNCCEEGGGYDAHFWTCPPHHRPQQIDGVWYFVKTQAVLA